jgi:hypothetical protein
MPTILLIEKSGSIKELSSKNVTTEELYKKAGFKTSESFDCANTWSETINGKIQLISIYGKTKGRAGQENKYDFPPPIDNILFFGTCSIICRNENGTIIDLTKKEWLKIYEKLFGGFEDLDDDEDEDAVSEDTLDEQPLTKEGYIKDGFIVDDVVDTEDVEDDDIEEDEDEDEIEDVESTEEEIEDEEEEEDEEDDEEEEDDEIDEEDTKVIEKKTKKSKSTKILTKDIVKNPVVIHKKISQKAKKESERITRLKTIQSSNSSSYLNCSDELEEESYI